MDRGALGDTCFAKLNYLNGMVCYVHACYTHTRTINVSMFRTLTYTPGSCACQSIGMEYMHADMNDEVNAWDPSKGRELSLIVSDGRYHL